MKPAVSHAIWALTAGGAERAFQCAEALGDAEIFLLRSVTPNARSGCRVRSFDRLTDAVSMAFHRYRGHVFFMATGIVVRMIAPHLRGKTIDPAVVVVDDRARYAVSLLSGHIGGANALTRKVAGHLGAAAVITTASDVNDLPAIDRIATERGLAIENPAAIKFVQRTLLENRALAVYDPRRRLGNIPGDALFVAVDDPSGFEDQPAGVFVDDIRVDLPPHVLVLRPGSLAVGVGCNRGTDAREIRTLLESVFETFRLATGSVRWLATVSLKKDEPGLLQLSESFGIPVRFYEKDELNRVPNIPTPSPMAAKHIGVKSVCEAAAILASEGGRLIVTKHSSPNATLAVARTACS